MKFLKSIQLLLCFMIIVIPSYSFRLEGIDFNQRMDGKDGGYREFKLINSSVAKQRYKVNILKGNENDGSKFITVFPKVVTINPQDKSSFKVFAKAPEGTENGLYSFMLQFVPVAVPTLAKAKEGVVTGTSNVNIAPVVEMYGYVGEINFQEALNIKNLNFEGTKDGMNIKGTLTNNSYATVEVGLSVYGDGDYLLGSEYIGVIGKKEKHFNFKFKHISKEKEIKKLVLYRSVNGNIEILKTINI